MSEDNKKSESAFDQLTQMMKDATSDNNFTINSTNWKDYTPPNIAMMVHVAQVLESKDLVAMAGDKESHKLLASILHSQRDRGNLVLLSILRQASLALVKHRLLHSKKCRNPGCLHTFDGMILLMQWLVSILNLVSSANTLRVGNPELCDEEMTQPPGMWDLIKLELEENPSQQNLFEDKRSEKISALCMFDELRLIQGYKDWT